MEIKIDRFGFNGEGIGLITEGKNKGKIAFVDYVLPEEIVDCEIVEEKKKFCNCVLKNIINKSSDRIVPRCKYFSICGGCDLQHIDEKLQLEIKKNSIMQTLKKVANLDVFCKDVISKNNFNYRNKMVFPIVNINNKNIIGMFKNNSHIIEDINYCYIANEKINEVLNLSKRYFTNSNIKGFDFNTNCGDLKYLVVRNYGEQVLITLVVSRKLDFKNYYDFMCDNFSKLGLSVIVSDNGDDILSGDYYHLYGERCLKIEEFGICYEINNLGFMQVNSEIKLELYTKILENIDESSNVVDCYSGAGLMTAIVSKKCKKAIGIEINKSAHESAIKLKKDNHLSNVDYECGDVSKKLFDCIKKFTDCTLILDPPKSGCSKSVIECISNNSNKVEKILYISCNVSTLARDLNSLKDKYDILEVQPYNMFPQTKHVETLVVLERKG